MTRILKWIYPVTGDLNEDQANSFDPDFLHRLIGRGLYRWEEVPDPVVEEEILDPILEESAPPPDPVTLESTPPPEKQTQSKKSPEPPATIDSTPGKSSDTTPATSTTTKEGNL
jgi:hypothetical protein